MKVGLFNSSIHFPKISIKMWLSDLINQDDAKSGLLDFNYRFMCAFATTSCGLCTLPFLTVRNINGMWRVTKNYLEFLLAWVMAGWWLIFLVNCLKRRHSWYDPHKRNSLCLFHSSITFPFLKLVLNCSGRSYTVSLVTSKSWTCTNQSQINTATLGLNAAAVSLQNVTIFFA